MAKNLLLIRYGRGCCKSKSTFDFLILFNIFFWTLLQNHGRSGIGDAAIDQDPHLHSEALPPGFQRPGQRPRGASGGTGTRRWRILIKNKPTNKEVFSDDYTHKI